MLTADLVRVRRKGDTLTVPSLNAKTRARAVEIARGYVAAVRACEGQPRAAFKAACAEVPVHPAERRIADGLRKLLTDRCTFEMREGVDPPALRDAVFARACAVRRALGPGESFDRAAVLAEVAAELGGTPEEVDAGLFADLKKAHLLLAFEPISPERLVEAYETAQAQAVLLRAVRLTARVRCATPGAYRHLFRALKFRRLLYSIQREEARDEYRLEIDGPHSLFQASTKYGLQLALVLPAIQACDRWHVEADVRWGKARRPLRFEIEGGASSEQDGDLPRLPDEVEQLVERFRALDTEWRVRPSSKILDLPGVGLCVPDLVFTHRPTKTRAYLEVMGYWSRAAVWRRVELVQAGLSERILFAVSTRLRVSEAVLDDDLPGELYVYKGVISARTVAERLEHMLSERDQGAR